MRNGSVDEDDASVGVRARQPFQVGHASSVLFHVLLLLLLPLPPIPMRLGGLQPVDGRQFGSQMSPRIVETQYGKLRGIVVAVPVVPAAGGSGTIPEVVPGGPAAGGSSGSPSLVEAYLGLQYATLLEGELRFMPPTGTLEKWEGIKVAFKFRPVCPQPAIPSDEEMRRDGVPLARIEHLRRLAPYLERQHEECLHLNVYVPVRDSNLTLNSEKPSRLLPVVIFIHGESYDIGSGNAYDGSVLASVGQIIVITLNYRLGALGFLSTEDSNAPGNNALLDLVAALHWVKENIQAFGGDPGEITLLGHGHGAALVNILLISPVTKARNLFRRVILHSGSALTSWAIVRHPLRFARLVADQLNCSAAAIAAAAAAAGFVTPVSRPTTPAGPAAALHAIPGSARYSQRADDESGAHHRHSDEFLPCLKHLPFERLARLVVRAPLYLSAFGPTVDGRAVLPDSVPHVMGRTSQSVLASTALLAGFTRNEGLAFVRQPDIVDGVGRDRWRKVLRTYVQNVYDFHRQSIYDVIVHQYSDWDRPGGGSTGQEYLDQATRGPLGGSTGHNPLIGRDTLVELLGDAQTTAPLLDVVAFHARHASPGVPTYLYEMNHPARADVYPRWATGSPGDELLYVFGAPLSDSAVDPFPTGVYSRADKLLADTVIRYWTNFIKTGNPNVGYMTSTGRDSDTARAVKSKNPEVTWPQYDYDKQEYLVIEKKSQEKTDDVTRQPQQQQQQSVRHHYRGAKMALWLDLIPRLHRSDNLDVRYHQLDDFNNRSTFEDNGTRQPDPEELLLLRSLASASSSSHSVQAINISAASSASSSPPGHESAARRQTTARPRRSTTSHHDVAPSGESHNNNVAATAAAAAAASTARAKMTIVTRSGDSTRSHTHGSSGGVVPLTVVVGLGCALLVANGIVFVALYRRRCQLDKRQQLQQQLLLSAASNAGAAPGGGESEQLFDDYDAYGSTTSTDFKKNNSCGNHRLHEVSDNNGYGMSSKPLPRPGRNSPSTGESVRSSTSYVGCSVVVPPPPPPVGSPCRTLPMQSWRRATGNTGPTDSCSPSTSSNAFFNHVTTRRPILHAADVDSDCSALMMTCMASASGQTMTSSLSIADGAPTISGSDSAPANHVTCSTTATVV